MTWSGRPTTFYEYIKQCSHLRPQEHNLQVTIFKFGHVLYDTQPTETAGSSTNPFSVPETTSHHHYHRRRRRHHHQHHHHQYHRHHHHHHHQRKLQFKNVNIFLFSLIDVFNSDSAYYYCRFIVILIVTWDPKGKKQQMYLNWHIITLF